MSVCCPSTLNYTCDCCSTTNSSNTSSTNITTTTQSSLQDDATIQLSNKNISYLIGGLFSIILLLFVLLTYCRFKRIRQHPAPLMFARTIADAGFIFTFLILSIIADTAIIVNANTDNTTAILHLQTICNRFGTLAILFFSASQFYFIGMCYDLYITLTYPLRSTTSTAIKIHVIVWCLAIVFAVIGLFVEQVSFDYIEDNELCFFRTNEKSIELWIIIIGPYILGILSGISSLVFVFFRLRNGLSYIFKHATYDLRFKNNKILF